MRRAVAIVTAALLAGGCKSIISDTSSSDSGYLIPNKSLNISKSISLPLEGLALGAAVFFIVDPLAPNWEVQHERIGADRYRLSLRMKRFTTGGDGEAMQVMRRSAERMVREGGYADYQLLQFSQGIESNVPIAQRVSSGVIQLVKAP
jgi:hypothetical protein